MSCRQVALAVFVTLAGCDDGSAEVVCPLLAPGALTAMTNGASIFVDSAGATVTGSLGPGGLASHAFVATAEQRVSARVSLDHGRSVAILYGPRDSRGGYPHCLAIGNAPSDAGAVTIEHQLEEPGEYLVVVGSVPGDGATDYSATLTCLDGCDQAAACPTLESRGCPDVRCDGELVSDASGCPTCVCDPTAQCGPQRAAGPAGSCVLPACECPLDNGSPVCGSDGQTWPSACHARCAQVVPIKQDSCEIGCPALAACESPCFGTRSVGDDGCPTCQCLPEFSADAASCQACPGALAPVCGDDGVTYLNRCRARCAGARLLYAGACVAGCRAPPIGCELDCPWGLRLQADGDECLSCACAPTPPAGCQPDDAPVCVSLAGLAAPTTVGSACLALHLGADDGEWGPCGIACDDETPCPTGASCQDAGLFAGRCLLDAPACGCSAVIDEVCGDDGGTWANACLAACAEVAVVHRGDCCAPAATCAASERGRLDATGCLVGCDAGGGEVTGCAEGAATQVACTLDGMALDHSACASHLDGVAAWPGWCPP